MESAARARARLRTRTPVAASNVESVKSNQILTMMLSQIDQLSVGVGNLDMLAAEDASIEAKSATEAMVTFPPAAEGEMPEVFNLVKDGGNWKIEMDSQLAAIGGAAGLQAQMGPFMKPLKAMGGAFAIVAGKLDGGQYADAEAMLIDMNAEVSSAILKASGLGGPGGGGQGGG
jgi:hypothetical protein